MSSLPQKSIKGAVFKTWAIQSIDKLIDYLSGTFIRGGKGIAIRRSAGVTIIELEKQPEQVQQNATGGATQDISASTGNNPSIEISGSTSSVQFVGTGNVTITGNTNGQIEVGVSGATSGVLGFPDYSNPDVQRGNVDISGTTMSYAHPVWLMGSLGAHIDGNGDTWADIILWIGTSPNTARFDIFNVNAESEGNSNLNGIEVSVTIPIPANTPFYFDSGATDLNYLSNELAIYPCL